jgi:hypothetical protein
MVMAACLCENLLKCRPSAGMTKIQFTCCQLPMRQSHGHMLSANVAAPNFKYRPPSPFQITTMGCKVLTGMISCDPDSLWHLGMGLKNITSRISWPNLISVLLMQTFYTSKHILNKKTKKANEENSTRLLRTTLFR